MNTIQINNANIRINENCHILDTGIVEFATIDIAEWIEVLYTYIGPAVSPFDKQVRHVKIWKNSSYIGTGVILDNSNIEIITEICGDNAHSILDILALATSGSNISVEGVARVDSPFRQVSTRVDQTNILIGHGARVRWVPRLEIATEDIEGGHSCKMHRLGGDVLFYLTSRGLTAEHAEAMLLNSEILKHLRTVDESEREKICYDIHVRLKK